MPTNKICNFGNGNFLSDLNGSNKIKQSNLKSYINLELEEIVLFNKFNSNLLTIYKLQEVMPSVGNTKNLYSSTTSTIHRQFF